LVAVGFARNFARSTARVGARFEGSPAAPAMAVPFFGAKVFNDVPSFAGAHRSRCHDLYFSSRSHIVSRWNFEFEKYRHQRSTFRTDFEFFAIGSRNSTSADGGESKWGIVLFKFKKILCISWAQVALILFKKYR
jgi:hypothetical protein